MDFPIPSLATFKSVIALVSGPVIWEGVKFIYPEIKRKIEAFSEAKGVFYKNLDPILKSTDEMYGKICSLAKEDFSTFINVNNSISDDPVHNRIYFYYLVAQFWASLEFIRRKSQYSSLSRIKKGKQLLRFIETCESRNYRLIDRSIQRIIGESLIIDGGGDLKIMTLFEFCNALENGSGNLGKWILKLDSVLMNVGDKDIRQRVLRYGVIAAVLIDHFDPKHKIVRRREIYLNKLSEHSKEMIKRDLLGHYLAFIKNGKVYYKK